MLLPCTLVPVFAPYGAPYINMLHCQAVNKEDILGDTRY